MHQKEMYEEELKIFWDTMKDHLIQCRREREEYDGAISLKSQEIKEKLKNHEERLKKMSSSFKKDLEKIISEDKDIRNIGINAN